MSLSKYHPPDLEDLPECNPELLPTLVQLMQFFLAPSSGIIGIKGKQYAIILQKLIVILQLVSFILGKSFFGKKYFLRKYFCGVIFFGKNKP